MRSQPSEVKTQGGRDRSEPGARRRSIRKSQLRRVNLEALEPRTLLATLPAPTLSNPADISDPFNANNTHSNESTPSIAVDRNNPLKLAAAWVRNDPNLAPGVTIFVEAAVSIDGGAHWNTPIDLGVLINPHTSNPALPFPEVTDPTVAFDRNDNFYVLDVHRTTDNLTGELALTKFNFSGTNPTTIFRDKVLKAWVPGGDQFVAPTLAVDDNLLTFTDTFTNGQTATQSDPFSGNVYVAYGTNDLVPGTGPNGFNPNTVQIMGSADGGQTFTGQATVNRGAYLGNERDTAPRLAVSQGRPARPPGANSPNDPGQAALPGGQVSVVWDDFGSASQASPPFDLLWANTVQGGVAAVFPGPIGPITDAFDPGNSQPHIPGVTDFKNSVAISDTRFTNLSKLTVTVNVVHPALAELSLVLIPPNGLAPITLVSNQTDSAGVTDPFAGVSGANFGIDTISKAALGTTFDDQASRDIVDIIPGTINRGAAAPFIGQFRPEQAGALAALNGLTPAQLNGTWKLEITDFRKGNVGFLTSWSLNFTGGLTTGVSVFPGAGPDGYQISSPNFVRGTATNTAFPVASAATPNGIGPNVTIASDNTLGAYSPFEGRLYATFVDRPDPTLVPTPPPDYTYIRLATSDDGGANWTVVPRTVNDDLAVRDGYTEGNPGFFDPTGRPHFDPSVAVDDATGTVVVSWYDARNDASRARVATYVTASVDGGQTFSPNVFANSAQTAKDAITGKIDVIGPVPDNQSAGNPNRETTFGFGTRQGLAVYGGKIHPIWSSSVPIPGSVSVPAYDGGIDGKARLDIRTATLTTALGPRIVASTMGPVGSGDDPVAPGDPINVQTTADGTPIIQSFHVQFDRPVDPSTFTAVSVTVMFRDTTPANVSGGPVPVLKVTPLDLGPYGATLFRVDFAPRSAIGTYSYTVGPNVSDRIRASSRATIAGTITTTTFVAPADQVNLPIPLDSASGDTGNPNSPTTFSHVTVNLPKNPVVASATVNLSINHTYDSDMVISLIAPDGTTVLLSNHLGDQPFVFLGANFTNTTFDDNAPTPISQGFGPFTGSFAPDTPLQQLQLHPANGTWTLSILDDIPLDIGTLLNWSLTLETGTPATGGSTVTTPGNLMDQNANARPGENPGDVYAAPKPANGGAPYTAPFDQNTLPMILPGPHVVRTRVAGSPVTGDNLVLNKTASSIDVTFDRAMAIQSFTPADVLRLMGPTGQINGPFTVAAAYNSIDVNKTFPLPGQSTIDSTLDLSSPENAGFTISHLTVQLNVTLAQASDLTATLIAPDGTRIALFSGVGGTSGQNFIDTVLDDTAATPIAKAVAPFNGSFRPSQAIDATLAGKPLQGIWTLELADTASDGKVGTLNSWSLAANPTGPAYARTFRVGFAQQELSGTYVVSLASSIQSKNGDALDTNLNAGLDQLKGTASAGATQAVTYNSTNVPTTIIAQKSVGSTLTVPDSFVLQGLTLTLNITYPNDPDLEATLIAPDGTRVQLFTNVGATGTLANFSNTTFDDTAATPIQNGGPPFFGRFNPQQPLSQLTGKNAAGIWTLQIKDDAPTNPSGLAQLNSWSLTFQKPLSSSGLGEPVSDQVTASFRIFTMDPTNPLSSSSWTAVGPAAINSAGGGAESFSGGTSGRIGGIAVDPSDPSGNTVYIGGASGGIWKTTNFLAPGGPTYVPLTDFGPSFAINIGSIAVFGRNSDPTQSIVFGVTGEGDTGSPGVGFIRSMDGGATWTLLDSTNNSLPFSGRDHLFAKNGGSTAFKILVDPKPAPDGNVIVYAALSGGNGGVWRSLDTGATWQNMRTGQATDITLDPNSGTGSPGGNLQILYAGFRGEGVFFSPNRGQVWNLMTGGVGDPLIVDAEVNPPSTIPVTPPSATPNGAKGRIVLAKPALTGNPVHDVQYQGWLYALVVTTVGHVDGLYVTKDFGQNWTRVRIPTLPSVNSAGSAPQVRAIPSNDANDPDYDVGGGGSFTQGNYDLSMAVDPTNPSVVYLGGTADGQPTGFIRVDISKLADPHALVAYSDTSNDGGTLTINSTGPLTVKRTLNNLPPAPYFNLIRNPAAPFLSNATLRVLNSKTFNNQGTGVTWIPFDIGGTDQHRFVTEVDPLTGHARLIIGDDQGVFTAVDDNGTFSSGIGTAPFVSGSRSGNLQITQFYYGAAQPSNLAAQIAGAMFYGSAQDNGGPFSDPNVLANGNITWTGPGGDAGGVATNYASTPAHPAGDGTLYQYWWPCCGGRTTDFFQVNGTGRTFGLLQASNPGPTPDPQWPFGGGANFAVNPLNGDQVMISSFAGRIFATENRGLFWSVIGDPAALDSTQSLAMAYGAPDPNGPGGIGNLDNFLYVGTNGGKVFVTQTGGGGAGNQWTNVSAGLDGSSVHAIVTNPTRGSHEAYAVTSNGVYHINNSIAAGATWQNITGTGAGNIFNLTHNIFGDATQVDTEARYLSSIVADWRYVIPDDFSNPNSPTHPMLYVGGEAGVYRSTDNGKTWDFFPDEPALGSPPPAPGQLGVPPTPPAGQVNNLPVNHISDLDLSLGAIDPTNGRPIVTTASANVLLASTYGQGAFSIHLAPVVFANTLHFDINLPAPGGSDSGSSNNDRYTNVVRPYIDGLSEQTAFGNVVTVNLIDETDPTNPVLIGTGTTTSTGSFSVQVVAGHFKTDGSTDGLKTIGVQAVDQAGTKGNIATFQFTLDTLAPVAPGTPVLESGSDSGQVTLTYAAPPSQVGTTIPGTGSLVSTLTAAAVNGRTADTVTVNVSIAHPLAADLVLTLTAPDGTSVLLSKNEGGIGGNFTNTTFDDTAATPISAGTAPFTGSFKPETPLAALFNHGIAGTWKLTVQNSTADGQTGTLLNWSLTIADSGNRDDITNVTNPTFDITTVEPATTVVYLLRDGAVVAQTAAAQPFVSLQDPGPVPDGVHLYNAKQIDLAGNIGPVSPPLSVTILTVAPAAPAAPVLDPNDDSGTKGDDITNVTQPHLDGSAAPNGLIQLIDAAGNVIGQSPIGSNGTYTVQPNTVLANGTYSLRVQDQDIAGNLSAPSAPLILTILNESPAKPTILLVPADDSSHGQDITNVTRPRIEGVATPGLTVTLVDAAGNPLVPPVPSGIVAPDGSYLLQFPSDLADGTYIVRTLVSDVAGNTSLSDPLMFRILTKVTGSPPTLILSPADDTSHGRDVTTVRRPHFLGTAPPNAFVDLLNTSGTVLATTIAGGDGKFIMQLPSDLNNGHISLQARIRDVAGNEGKPSAVLNVTIATIGDDYDNSGKGSLAVFRPNTAQFFILQAVAGPRGQQFGAPGDTPIQGDFDGDGKIDIAVFRPSTATWFISRSTLGPEGRQFGEANVDVPVQGDFDGDGRTDLAVYRPPTGQWFILQSSAGGEVLQLPIQPQAGDIPVPGDYDGSGHTEIAIYRPSTATWYIQESGGLVTKQFGEPGVDIPVPAEFDGDGKTSIAVYRPPTAEWFILGSSTGPRYQQFGIRGDIPVPANYDGSGSADLAVFRPSTATWYINQAIGGLRVQQFGAPNLDIPVNAPYRFRATGSVSAFGSVAGNSGVGGGGSSGRAFDFGQQALSLAASASASSASGSIRRSLQVDPGPIAPPPSAATLPALGSPRHRAHAGSQTHRQAAVHQHAARHVPANGRLHDAALELALDGGVGRFGTRRQNG